MNENIYIDNVYHVLDTVCCPVCDRKSLVCYATKSFTDCLRVFVRCRACFGCVDVLVAAEDVDDMKKYVSRVVVKFEKLKREKVMSEIED